MDYVLTVGDGDYVYKTLEAALDHYDGEDTAILYKRGYINGEWHEELIAQKFNREGRKQDAQH